MALLISTVGLGAVKVAADTTVTSDVSVTVSSSCTFTAGGGTYSESVVGGNTATITANPITTNCNDPSGYAIYAIGYSGDSYSATTHTDMISSLGSSYNIKTDGTGTYGSSWKMKLTNPSNATISGNFGSSYQNIPSTFTQVATYANNTTSGSITPSYQVAVSSSQPAGTYTGKVKYVLVHPNTTAAGTYNIAYNANGGSGTTTGHTGVYNFDPVTLNANGFTRSGYAFAGWCTTNTSQYSCTDGVLYQSGDGVTSLGTAGSTVTLYAIWNELCAGYTTMQELDSSSIATLLPTTGSTATVCDTRDEGKYTIGKLADNNYWMLDNLALDLTDSTVLSAMDSTNTNASDTTLGYLKNGGGTTSDQYATAAVANWTSSYSYSAPLVNMTNKDTVPQGSDPLAAEALAGNWKIGGYYNYCAASAGSYCYGNGTSAGTSSGNASESICPKGWRLPTGNTTGEYSALANAIYGSTGSTSDATAYANYRAALHLPLSGYFRNGSPLNQGSSGRWWSSTRNNNNYVYYLVAYTSYIYPALSDFRNYGFSVRCVMGS
ncbi:InlB B-repeat-containing protein [Candidatus Saccharibacteria bacterium]|nr:InlB B-repeat-containing protein [Candidatus Saccharibacteria bacterium]